MSESPGQRREEDTEKLLPWHRHLTPSCSSHLPLLVLPWSFQRLLTVLEALNGLVQDQPLFIECPGGVKWWERWLLPQAASALIGDWLDPDILLGRDGDW